MADVEATVCVEVAHALPETQLLLSLCLPAGATAADALQASGLLRTHPDTANADSPLAVFGRRVELRTVLADGDRLEVLRPLRVDPKQRRRQRAAGEARRRRLR